MDRQKIWEKWEFLGPQYGGIREFSPFLLIFPAEKPDFGRFKGIFMKLQNGYFGLTFGACTTAPVSYYTDTDTDKKL